MSVNTLQKSQPGQAPKLSIVSPVYRSADCIAELVRRIQASISGLVDSFEIVLVDDGSPDQAWQRIIEQSSLYHQVKGVRLSRNFGQHHAIAAGLAHSSGDWVVIMDCDLQNRPEDIPVLFNRAQQGHEIVLSRRKNRNDPLISTWGSKAYFWALAMLSGKKSDPEIGAFSILSRSAVQAFLKLEEHHRSTLELLNYVGFAPEVIDLVCDERPIGKSSYSFGKKCLAAINEITSQSARLLYAAIATSFCMAACAGFFLTYVVIRATFGGFGVPGWPSLIAVMLFIGGFLGCIMGIVGMYLAKVYLEVRRRPLYFVSELRNFR